MQRASIRGRLAIAIVLLVVTMTGGATVGNGASYSDWCLYRDALIRDPALLAYYTFENVDSGTVQNMVKGRPDLMLQDIWLTDGRWSEKPAIHLDREVVKGPGFTEVWQPPNKKPTLTKNIYFPNITNRMFTVECWYRNNGQGEHRDNNSSCGGILSVHSGHGDGWRLVANAVSGNITFQFGQPPAGRPCHVTSGPVSTGCWHHVVATWNGDVIRLYVDGVISASRPFTGTYKEDPLPDGRANFKRVWLDQTPEKNLLVIGYADFGVGSLSLDVDEVAVYQSALSDEAVRAHYQAGNTGITNTHIFPSVDVQFPTNTCGCFPVGTRIPVGVRLSTVPGKYTVEFRMLDEGNQTVWRQATMCVVKSGREGTVDKTCRIPKRCGLYWVQCHVTDEQGRLIFTREYPLAAIVKLPPISTVSADSPLGVQPLSAMPQGQFLGMKWDRLWMRETQWAKIEAQRGSNNWTETDALVAESLQAGTEILYTIHGLPDWAFRPNMPKDHENNGCGFQDIRDWERFVEALVNRYKDRIHAWEIFNEPDATYRPVDEQAKDYVRLLQSAYRIIKRLDPKAVVVGSGSYCPTTIWPEKVFNAGGGPFMDVFGFHYSHVGDNPSKVAQKKEVEKLKELMIQHLGHALPMWNTETGVQQAPWLDKRPMHEELYRRIFADAFFPDKDFCGKFPDERASRWEIQAALCDFAAGAEKRFVHGGGERIHGLRAVAYAALAQVVTTMKSAAYLTMDSLQAMGVLITDKADNQTAVLWSTSTNEVQITMTVPSKRTLKGMDYLGNPLTFKANRGELSLRLTADPVYVFLGAHGFGVADIKIRMMYFAIDDAVLDLTQPYSAKLRVVNQFADTTLRGTFDATLPNGWQIEMNRELTVAPAASVSVPFTVRLPAQTADGFYPVTVTFRAGEQSVAWAQAKYLVEKYLVKNIHPLEKYSGGAVTNGTAQNWAGIATQNVDRADRVMIGLPNAVVPGIPCWNGPPDLSYTVQTCWSDAGVHVRVAVTDEAVAVAPPDKASTAYLYDCVELFLSLVAPAGAPAQVGKSRSAQFTVIPALNETPTACRVSATPSAVDLALDTSFIGYRTPVGYVIEGTIKPCANSPLTLRPGMLIDFNVAVDDGGPMPGARKTQMALFGSEPNFYADPSVWGRFRMEGSP